MQVIAVTVSESGADSEAAAYDIIQLLGFNCGFLQLRFAAQPLKLARTSQNSKKNDSRTTGVRLNNFMLSSSPTTCKHWYHCGTYL